MRSLITMLFFLLASFIAEAQVNVPPPIVFGEIPKEDIDMKSYEPDPSAAAVVLCNYGTVEPTDRVYMFKYKYHKRIKLLKKEGYDYSNISIHYKHLWDLDEIENIEAQVKLTSGSLIKLKKKDIHHEKLDDVWSVVKFIFPKLEPGCIIEYKYEVTVFEMGNIRQWYFQDDIPVKSSEFRINLPLTLQYTYFLQGVSGLQKTDFSSRHTIYEGNGMRCDILTNRFIFKNVPAFKPEAFIASVNDCLIKIRFQLSELQFAFSSYGVNNTWQEFKNMMLKAPWFGEQFDTLKNSALAASEISPNVDGALKSRERAEFYYWHVANNMRWNQDYSFMMERMVPLDTIYQERSGSSGELNLLLLALLRHDGFEANPVLISTRSNGRPYVNFPLRDQFNHVMVQVNLDSTAIIMDATDPLRLPGFPDLEALNGQGLLMKHDTAYWIPILPPADGTDFFKYEATLSENGDLQGRLKSTYKGYNALLERQRYTKEVEDKHWEERLTKKFPTLVIDAIGHGDPKLVSNVFYDSLYFHATEAAQANGDFLYISPVFFSSFEENLFKEEKRQFPIDFAIPILEQYQLKLKTPTGYMVESLPKSTKVSLASNGGSFTFSIEKTGEYELNVYSRLQFKQTLFMPEEYSTLKDMMKMISEKMAEMIVLKKAQ